MKLFQKTFLWKQDREKKQRHDKIRELGINILMILGTCAVWQAAAAVTDNALVCPGLEEIVQQMMLQLRRPDFWMVIGATTARALTALLISFIAGLLAAFAAFFWSPAARFFNAASGFLQTIPNVCYIILLLFWTSRQSTVLLVAFFLLFPLVYRTLFAQLSDLEHEWKDVWGIYPQPKSVMIFRICLPAMKASVSSSLKNASSLAFKVCVMTEILAGISLGVGRSLQINRLDINVAGVIGWSLWLILIVFLFEKLWNLLLKFFYR